MLGLRPRRGAAHSGEDRREDVIAQGEQGGDGAGCTGGNPVAAGLAGLDGQVLAAELAQVAGGLPDGIGFLPGHRPDPGGEVRDGEPAGRGGQCGPHPGPVQGLWPLFRDGHGESARVARGSWATAGGSGHLLLPEGSNLITACTLTPSQGCKYTR